MPSSEVPACSGLDIKIDELQSFEASNLKIDGVNGFPTATAGHGHAGTLASDCDDIPLGALLHRETTIITRQHEIEV